MLDGIAVITDNVNMTTDTESSQWYESKAWPTLIATNDYYLSAYEVLHRMPFGLAMSGRTSQLTETNAYRYGFNGKELDNWNQADQEPPSGGGPPGPPPAPDDAVAKPGSGTVYDYGFRIYNPRIAKFLSVDPLTKSYPMLTPYQFASNTPIWAIDLDGLEAMITVYQTSKDFGYEPIFRIYEDDETFSQTLTNFKNEYPTIPESGAVNIIVDEEGNYLGQQFTPELIIEGNRPSKFQRELYSVGDGFNALGGKFIELKDGKTENARVARNVISGIVGVGLAIPSGGASLTWVSLGSLGFSANTFASGVADAVDGKDFERNLLREGSKEIGGETGGQVYDFAEFGFGIYGISQGLFNIKRSIENKNTGVILKESINAAKNYYELESPIEPNENLKNDAIENE